LFHRPPTTAIYTLSLHDALPICALAAVGQLPPRGGRLVDQRCEAAGLPGPLDQRFRVGLFVAVVDEFVRHGKAVQPLARLAAGRSEEHTSELQSRENLVCRLLLE